MPTMIDGSFGLPIIVGNCERGASSEARPDFVNLVPRSITTAIDYYMFIFFIDLCYTFI